VNKQPERKRKIENRSGMGDGAKKYFPYNREPDTSISISFFAFSPFDDQE